MAVGAVLPPELRYFINALPSTTCALVDDLPDLHDGRVLTEITWLVEVRATGPFSSRSLPSRPSCC